jgi:hypothetical protein
MRNILSVLDPSTHFELKKSGIVRHGNHGLFLNQVMALESTVLKKLGDQCALGMNRRVTLRVIQMSFGARDHSVIGIDNFIDTRRVISHTRHRKKQTQ